MEATRGTFVEIPDNVRKTEAYFTSSCTEYLPERDNMILKISGDTYKSSVDCVEMGQGRRCSSRFPNKSTDLKKV